MPKVPPGEAARFVDGRNPDQISPVPRGVEAARSATEVFKRLLYLSLEHPNSFLEEVQAAWAAHESTLALKVADTVELGQLALFAAKRELLRRHLTRFVHGELLRALDMAAALASSIDIRRQIRFGITTDTPPKGPEQIW